MKIKVLLFATLKDLTGHSGLTMSLIGETATIENVREALGELHPQIRANLKVAIVAINQEYAFAQDVVRDGDEVAFFPPVSGGSDYPDIFQLADKIIDIDALLAAITVPATGAVCLFSGMVRGETESSDEIIETEHLEYEAYEPMALAKMRQVAEEIRRQWPLVQGIAIVQRIGKLEVGQNTILIACASGHRDQGCFEAARYGIDRLKEIVPVWKKEIRPDGTSWIEGHYMPTQADREEH